VGWGAGTKDLPHPNALRVFVGEMAIAPMEQRLVMLETNLDDMNPEFFDYLMDSLFAAGALDVFYTSVLMKKSRPATLVTVLTDTAKANALREVIFRETTTLGIRSYEVTRLCLEREWHEVETEFGPVRVKVGRAGGDVVTAAPEYEDCRRLARESGTPVKAVYQAALSAFERSARKAEG
jgi:uncharacterized protein (DUF111 family)